MRHFTYLLILTACLLGTLPLEFVLHTRVYAQWRRLALTLLPVAILFGLWDMWAVRTDTWFYDARYVLGITVPGHLPLEEVLFFLVVPVCSILALEAVLARKPHWAIE